MNCELYILFFFFLAGVCPSSEACSRIKELTANLAALKEDSTLVKVGQGFLMLQDKNFSQARDLLKGESHNCSPW